MTLAELFQQIGFTKYEAEVYCTLLTHEPLTGYEVGKHSSVPLSRSYEILERLAQKNLALVQPGDPTRYTAQEPQRVLQQVRTSMEGTLGTLTEALAALTRPESRDDFWIVRGRQAILTQLGSMLATAKEKFALSIPVAYQPALAESLAHAQLRGCHIELAQITAERVLLLIDSQAGLVGTLTPAASCQAVVSTNSAFVLVLQGHFMQQESVLSSSISVSAPDAKPADADWLVWEERKQRRLWQTGVGHQVA